MRFSRAFVAGLLISIPIAAQQGGGSIEPPAGARVVLQAHGAGAQIYACAETGGALKWTLKGPDAKLSDSSGKEIGTHFAGPTWKLNDGGQVQGELMASQPSPAAGSVAWLLLRAKAGSATGTMADVAFIRRTETRGGVAPVTGCESAADAGKTVRVDYSATYSFYSAAK